MIKHSSLFSSIDEDVIIKMQNNKWTIHKTKQKNLGTCPQN